MSLAFYPGYWGFLAWFSLCRPMAILVKLRGREAFNASYFFGVCFTAFSMYWVALVTPPGVVAAIAVVALYYAITLSLFVALYRYRAALGLTALPFLWVGMEYFRTLSEFAFPWSDLGYTQSYYLYILQIVSITSVHGLSLLIVAVNVLVWQIFRKEVGPERRVTAGFVAGAVVLALVAYGWIEVPPLLNQGTYKVALLQGSVPIDIKWELENEGYSIKLYDSLSQSVAKDSAELFVWPESAAPCYLSDDAYSRNKIGDIARRSGGHHLVGALGSETREYRRRDYNSCYQFDRAGSMEARYDKIKLVPFSETVPYQDHLPFLQRDIIMKYLSLLEQFNVQWWSDFYPGDSIHLFTLPNATYGVLICFESTFPEMARQMILSGAEFLVGITNDTWFGQSVQYHMHSRIFVTRAVENRCWMARAANSGLTYVVDDYGRIRESLPHGAVSALVGTVRLLEKRSVYTRYGDFIGRWSLLVTLSILVILLALWIVRKIRS